MNTPLSSFTALVKFQFDRAGLTSEIAAVRKQLQGLTGRTLGVKLKYDKGSLNLPSFVNQTVKLKYVGEKQPTSPLTQNRLIRDIPLPSSLPKPKPEPRTNRVTSELLKVKLQASTLSLKDAKLTHIPKIKLTAESVSLKGVRITHTPKLKLVASSISLKDAKFTYKGKLKSKDFPPLKQEVKLHYTGKLTTLPVITQVVNMVYRNRQGNTTTTQTQGGGSSGSGGSPNPLHIGTMAGGLGGLITRGNLAAVGAGAFTQQSFTQANFDIAQAPQFEFITGSAEEAAKQVAFLNKEVDRLSLPLRETSNMYRQLLASTKKGLGIEKTQELFSSFSEISAMLGLSEDAQARGLRAFGQMAS